MLKTENAIQELSLEDLNKVSGGGYYESPSNQDEFCPSGRLTDFNAAGQPCVWNCEGTFCS